MQQSIIVAFFYSKFLLLMTPIIFQCRSVRDYYIQL